MTLVFSVVGRSESANMPFVSTCPVFQSRTNSLPAASPPMVPMMVDLPPKAVMLQATLAAPPGICGLFR